MKKNNKGFLLAEAFIVSAFVLGVLVFMYIQVRGLLNNYNKSFIYNTVSGIYITNEIGKYFTSNIYDDIKTDLEQYNYVDITKYNEFMTTFTGNAKIKQVIISALNFDWGRYNLVDAKFDKFIEWVKKRNGTGQNYGFIILTEFEDETLA